jgi:hypothetical protein
MRLEELGEHGVVAWSGDEGVMKAGEVWVGVVEVSSYGM